MIDFLAAVGGCILFISFAIVCLILNVKFNNLIDSIEKKRGKP